MPALILLGVVLIVGALPLMGGKVPPNHIYGLRTRRSMNGSKEDWYRLNRKAGQTLFWIGCATLATVFILVVVLRWPLFTR